MRVLLVVIISLLLVKCTMNPNISKILSVKEHQDKGYDVRVLGPKMIQYHFSFSFWKICKVNH